MAQELINQTGTFTLPPLYKIGAYDKVNVWLIGFNGNHLMMYWGTEMDMKNGSLQNSSAPVELNSTGRNIYEQALLEAKSRWKRKQDKDGYSEKLMDMSILTMPAMLANTWDPAKSQIKNYPVWVEPKLDGIRCRANMDENNKVVLISRTTLVISHFDHIRNDLQNLFPYIEEVLRNAFPDKYPLCRLDGELYTHEIPFDVLNGMARLSEGRKASDKEHLVSYFLFDCVINGNWTYDERLNVLFTAYGKYLQQFPNTSVRVLQPENAFSKEDILNAHAKYVQQGYEGVIIRMFGGKTEVERAKSYYLGRRCNAILKYKEFEDTEGVIVGAKTGTGTEEGAVVWSIRSPNGAVFDCRPRGTVPARVELAKQWMATEGREFLNRAYRYRYQGLTSEGTPRFPVGLGFVNDRPVPGATVTNTELKVQTGIGSIKNIGQFNGELYWLVELSTGIQFLLKVQDREETYSKWMSSGGAEYLNRSVHFTYTHLDSSSSPQNAIFLSF